MHQQADSVYIGHTQLSITQAYEKQRGKERDRKIKMLNKKILYTPLLQLRLQIIHNFKFILSGSRHYRKHGSQSGVQMDPYRLTQSTNRIKFSWYSLRVIWGRIIEIKKRFGENQ